MSIPTNKFQSVYLNPYVKPSYSFLSIILINVHILHALSQYNASTQNSWIDIIALSWLLPLPLSSPLDQTRPSLMEREPNSSFQFPPGFRFHPSDEELIVHYLQKKVTSHPLPASVIAEIDLYKYNPWELPSLSCTIYSLVLFFFSQIINWRIELVFIIYCSTFLFLQRRLCLEKKNGTSSVQEIVSTQTE